MDSDKRSEAMHSLDMRYQGTSHQYSIVVKEEEARRLKLRSVLLGDENATLKDQLARKGDQITRLSSKCDTFRDQIESAAHVGRQHEMQIRVQARELSNLKEEMNSLGTITQDSAKVLTDKLALSRELALLKPEVEHLRSQLCHQKDALAEKLALERQLNALEVELANEKRAAQKAASRQSRDSDAEEDLQKQIRDLEKQLAKEKRTAQKAMQNQESKNTAAEEELKELREKLAEAEKMLDSQSKDTATEELEEVREKLAETEKILDSERRSASKAAKTKSATATDSAEELEQLREELAEAKTGLAKERKEREQSRRDHEKALAEAEGRQLPLEEKLDNVKAKLRETCEELKQCRADLQRAQEQAAKKAAVKAPAGKKRRVNEISAEETLLHTPKGEDRPKQTVKRGFGPAAVGEKSTFSITPFLNKTINLSDVSLKPQAESTTDATISTPMERDSEPSTTDVSEEPIVKAAKPALVGRKPRGRPTTKVLGESSPSKKNMPALKRRKAPSAESTLEKVTEEADEDPQEQENPSTENATGKGASSLKKLPKILPPKTTSPTEAPTAPTAATAQQPEPKKKRRKLLGGASKTTTTMSLFGGEADAEDAERPPAAAATAATKRPPVARPAKRAVGLGAAKNAFAGASFSPLKRDRRGVNASFLA